MLTLQPVTTPPQVSRLILRSPQQPLQVHDLTLLPLWHHQHILRGQPPQIDALNGEQFEKKSSIFIGGEHHLNRAPQPTILTPHRLHFIPSPRNEALQPILLARTVNCSFLGYRPACCSGQRVGESNSHSIQTNQNLASMKLWTQTRMIQLTFSFEHSASASANLSYNTAVSAR
jgi:hypothetical protein